MIAPFYLFTNHKPAAWFEVGRGDGGGGGGAAFRCCVRAHATADVEVVLAAPPFHDIAHLLVPSHLYSYS